MTDRDFVNHIKHLPYADTWGTKKEIRYLKTILMDSETVNAVCSGLMDGRTWLMASTDKRVLLINKNMFIGMQQMEIPLNHINSITFSVGILLSKISIMHGSGSMLIENVQKGSEKYFVETTNKSIREYATNVKLDFSQGKAQITDSKTNIADEILKLKNLLDQGILTQEEFDNQKQKLLS